MEKKSYPFLLVFVVSIPVILAAEDDLIYGYECRNNICHKIELSSQNFQTAISLPVCRLLCSDTLGTVWPQPTNLQKVDSYLLRIDKQRIEFPNITTQREQQDNKLWSVNVQRFTKALNNKIPHEDVLKSGGHPLKIIVSVEEAEDAPRLTLNTDESYSLDVTVTDDRAVVANIKAKSLFGARHGLETLGQLFVYDDIRHELQILAKVSLQDKPAFKWRGLLLDTSRNFYSLKAIKRTLDGMAMVKLNTFHWHITDSHSFPMEVKSRPQLHKLGAYSPRKVYSHEDIAEVVEYGRTRGIRVLPEFDAPAHVGEGWQHTNMTACFNAQPWNQYCVEPPCGQLDPTNDDLYAVLQDIYQEIFDLFKPDVFHMGGDEVSTACWASSASIVKWMSEKNWEINESGFMRLWDHFQRKAVERVDLVAKQSKQVPIILWTSSLTAAPYLNSYLNNKRYIIQIWSKSMDYKIDYILKNGFQVIVSNYDGLYLDCGGASWINSGNNWCSPYIGWQKVYDNRMENIAGEHVQQVLGAEAAIWSEQIDEHNLDQRLWPRASALAERLWSNPSTSWRHAESRILLHREHLLENGIAAEVLQPEWCLQNQNDCPLEKYLL